MKKLIAALLAFAMLFSLCACGGTNNDDKTNDGTRVVTDACGREVTIPGTVKSVICVGVGSLRFTTYWMRSTFSSALRKTSWAWALRSPLRTCTRMCGRSFPRPATTARPTMSR